MSASQLGHTLRAARTTAQLSLQSVAKRVHISYQHLSRIERNERPITLEILGDLDGVYGLPDALLLAWVRRRCWQAEDSDARV